jgi:replicative DNA helicase
MVSLPPHDLDAEAVVLAGVLWGDRTAHQLGLRPRHFWSPEHQQLWAIQLTAEELLGDDLPAATRLWVALSVCSVGERYVRELLLCAPLWATVEGYAARVRELARQRWLIRHMHRIEHLWRQGERPSARLLRWTARRLEQMAVDGVAT